MTDDEASTPAALPEFPPLQTATSVRITRKQTFPAWSGLRAHLLTLEKLVHESLSAAYADRVSQLTASRPPDVAKAVEIRDRLKVVVNVGTKNQGMVRVGSLENVLAEMDESEIDYVVIANVRGSDSTLPEISVRLERVGSPTNHPNPNTISVDGYDKRWVTATFELIVGEMSKHVPGWSFMRSFRTAWFASSFMMCGVTGLVFSYWNRLNLELAPINYVLVGVMIIGLGGLFVSTLVNPLLSRGFPSFEVLSPSGRSRANRTTSIAFSILSLAVGLIGLALGFIAI